MAVSSGRLRPLVNGELGEEPGGLFLQVLAVLPLSIDSTDVSSLRFQVRLSDSLFSAMLPTSSSVSALIAEDELSSGQIVKIDRVELRHSQMPVVLALTVLPGSFDPLGNPEEIGSTAMFTPTAFDSPTEHIQAKPRRKSTPSSLSVQFSIVNNNNNNDTDSRAVLDQQQQQPPLLLAEEGGEMDRSSPPVEGKRMSQDVHSMLAEIQGPDDSIPTSGWHVRDSFRRSIRDLLTEEGVSDSGSEPTTPQAKHRTRQWDSSPSSDAGESMGQVIPESENKGGPSRPGVIRLRTGDEVPVRVDSIAGSTILSFVNNDQSEISVSDENVSFRGSRKSLPCDAQVESTRDSGRLSAQDVIAASERLVKKHLTHRTSSIQTPDQLSIQQRSCSPIDESQSEDKENVPNMLSIQQPIRLSPPSQPVGSKRDSWTSSSTSSPAVDIEDVFDPNEIRDVNQSPEDRIRFRVKPSTHTRPSTSVNSVFVPDCESASESTRNARHSFSKTLRAQPLRLDSCNGQRNVQSASSTPLASSASSFSMTLSSQTTPHLKYAAACLQARQETMEKLQRQIQIEQELAVTYLDVICRFQRDFAPLVNQPISSASVHAIREFLIFYDELKSLSKVHVELPTDSPLNQYLQQSQPPPQYTMESSSDFGAECTSQAGSQSSSLLDSAVMQYFALEHQQVQTHSHLTTIKPTNRKSVKVTTTKAPAPKQKTKPQSTHRIISKSVDDENSESIHRATPATVSQSTSVVKSAMECLSMLISESESWFITCLLRWLESAPRFWSCFGNAEVMDETTDDAREMCVALLKSVLQWIHMVHDRRSQLKRLTEQFAHNMSRVKSCLDFTLSWLKPHIARSSSLPVNSIENGL
eukprot:GILJ01010760.1.p1 GENE.GILJ01010760.1~~GILJ01010760.1.p1  ORF type:complete len:865 (+),score=146.96 GILJ01010760.1:35-2629(+)